LYDLMQLPVSLRAMQPYPLHQKQVQYSGAAGPKYTPGAPVSEAVLQKNPCYRCGKQGHWARECPATAEEQKQAKATALINCVRCGSTEHPASYCTAETFTCALCMPPPGKLTAEHPVRIDGKTSCPVTPWASRSAHLAVQRALAKVLREFGVTPHVIQS